MSNPRTCGAFIPSAPLAGPGQTIDLCAGPGGMDMGARILGLPDMVGVDLDADACDTARAAGFVRHQADIRHLDPRDYRGVTGMVATTPCPTFGASGKGTGREDRQLVQDAITCLGVDCSCGWEDLPGQVQDMRTALIVETARWALLAPDLEWFVAENAPAVQEIWYDLAAELSETWEELNIVTIEATDYGSPSRRRRSFLYGRRNRTTQVSPYPPHVEQLPPRAMAGVLGWEPGVRVWTRGAMKGKGGNAFSADGPSWCLTGSARSWKIGAPDGPELTASQAGLLNGFPADYPWQGSRTKQFQQVADVVSPIVAAVVLGTATDTPWVEPVRAYLDDLYSAPMPAGPVPSPWVPAQPEPAQGSLLDLLVGV